MSQLHEISGCKDEHRKADVIFVHGLGGDAFSTWRSGRKASWPHWLGKDVSEVGVWSLGYAASGSEWSLGERLKGSWLGRLKWPWLQRWINRGNRDSGHAMSLPRRAREVLDLLQLRGIGQRPIFSLATASAVCW